MVKVIFGMMGSSVASGSSRMATPDQVRSVLNILKRHKVRELDIARVYNGGRSEELLGEVKASQAPFNFAVSTKAPGFSPGILSASKIAACCRESLKALQQPKIDIFYFHGPDHQTPLAEQCKAANELYTEGKFERFGVSNLSLEEVQTIYDICKKEKYVLPTVYQGGFNPLLRSAEDELFPLLKKLGMAFYAFSPLGGGYFSKPVKELKTPPRGTRLDEMKVFKEIYVNDTSIGLLEKLTKACQGHGIAVKEATLRWFMHHSALGDEDGVILGASSEEQAEENLGACEGGRLPEDVAECFESMWPAYQHWAWKYHSYESKALPDSSDKAPEPLLVLAS